MVFERNYTWFTPQIEQAIAG